MNPPITKYCQRIARALTQSPERAPVGMNSCAVLPRSPQGPFFRTTFSSRRLEHQSFWNSGISFTNSEGGHTFARAAGSVPFVLGVSEMHRFSFGDLRLSSHRVSFEILTPTRCFCWRLVVRLGTLRDLTLTADHTKRKDMAHGSSIHRRRAGHSDEQGECIVARHSTTG